jgi:uncharacterized coiled-coil protein SlyX
MNREEEEVSHLERRICHLEKHIADQDAEIFRQSRLLAAVLKRLEKLEGRLEGTDSPEDPGSPADQKPPHY